MQNYWQRTFSNHRIIIFACCFNSIRPLGGLCLTHMRKNWVWTYVRNSAWNEWGLNRFFTQNSDFWKIILRNQNISFFQWLRTFKVSSNKKENVWKKFRSKILRYLWPPKTQTSFSSKTPKNVGSAVQCQMLIVFVKTSVNHLAPSLFIIVLFQNWVLHFQFVIQRAKD